MFQARNHKNRLTDIAISATLGKAASAGDNWYALCAFGVHCRHQNICCLLGICSYTVCLFIGLSSWFLVGLLCVVVFFVGFCFIVLWGGLFILPLLHLLVVCVCVCECVGACVCVCVCVHVCVCVYL